MSRTFQPKTRPYEKPSCASYIEQLYKLKLDLDTAKTFNEQLKKEAVFLRWSVAFALGLGFVVGALARGHI